MKKISGIALLLTILTLLGGCAGSAEVEPQASPVAQAETTWPQEKLQAGEDGVPLLDVYVVADEAVSTVDVETYVQGVLAGEMKNDWPLEALKAQASLARPVVPKFVEQKQSQYPGADISTDIEEAQAYEESAVNDRIRQAVEETRGLVLSSDGALPYAWFHAHSGGVTELAKAGLGWDKDEPGYTQVTEGNEPESAQGEDNAMTLADAQAWEAVFTMEEFEAACRKQGAEVALGEDSRLTIEERGDSGRATAIGVDGARVSATDLRIALGSTKMRSTLLTSLRVENSSVIMAGKGYGHGVGMSQWGAYGMARDGKTAEEIVTHYFRNVEVVSLW